MNVPEVVMEGSTVFYIEMKKAAHKITFFFVIISSDIQFVFYKQLQLLKVQDLNMYEDGSSAIFGMYFQGEKINSAVTQVFIFIICSLTPVSDVFFEK